MAPKKWLGVGAECTVSLRFLHPKDKFVEKIPNQVTEAFGAGGPRTNGETHSAQGNTVCRVPT